MLLLILTVSESFHVVAHLLVLFRIMVFKFEELQSMRWYFIWDWMSALVSASMTLGLLNAYLRCFVIIHFLMHAYYVLTWNKTHENVRVIQRFSDAWDVIHQHVPLWWKMWSVIGTLIDIAVHLVLIERMCFQYR